MGCKGSKSKQQKGDSDLKSEESEMRRKRRLAKSDDGEGASDTDDENNLEGEGSLSFDGNGGGGGRWKRRYKSIGPRDHNLNPIEEGDADVVALFKNGLLYKLQLSDGLWLMYNDTEEFEMHITWKFGPDSKVNACSDDVKLVRDTEETSTTYNWIVATAVVYPAETKEFIRGKPNGYKSYHSAKPLSAEYRAKINAGANRKVNGELTNIRKVANMRNPTSLDTAPLILERCVAQKVPFIDLHFPPIDYSIYRPHVDKRLFPSQAWKRPTDYLPLKDHGRIASVKNASPGDIEQGSLGNCWFLCAVANLAEFPNKIHDVFKHPTGNAEKRKQEEKLGAYYVTLNKHGWWYVFIIDSYFPCVGNKPCFSRSSRDSSELWVNLLEKAYAKAHGSYSSISGGDALHALQDLTGFPVRRIDREWDLALANPDGDGAGADELFDEIERYDRENYLITLNTPGEANPFYIQAIAAGGSKDFEERFSKAGLGMGHAYSVLKTIEFHNWHEGTGAPLRLLKIRNPWGKGTEWSGAWGDEDNRWNQHPEVARACNFRPAPDGAFWMDWEDCLRYFDGGGVCFVKNGWHDYRIKGAFVHGFPSCVLEIRTAKPVNCFLVLSQKDKRGLQADDPNREYAALLLSVSRSLPGGKKQQLHLNSSANPEQPTNQFTFNYARDLSLSYSFEPSEHPYLVVPRMYDSKDHGRTKDYVLGLVADTPIEAGEFEVCFKTMDKSSKVFANHPRFEYVWDKTADCETDYQYNPEEGCPITGRGTELDAGALMETKKKMMTKKSSLLGKSGVSQNTSSVIL